LKIKFKRNFLKQNSNQIEINLNKIANIIHQVKLKTKNQTKFK
jgi:hypothetical protein